MNEMNCIPVFFRPEMAAPNVHRFAPGADKPRQVVADWQAKGLPIELRTFEPVDEATLALAHDRAYVEDVLACRAPNGFGNRDEGTARSLPYTTGAMLAAAREAIASRTVACAPVSGFHHAHYAHAEDFCTFNGLMVTALSLVREGLARRVGILDLDQHYGNGTDDIVRTLRRRDVQHYTAGRADRDPGDAAAFLRRLPSKVSSFMDCDVLLYQAGADPHVADPLGGWMTDAQLSERDRIVFDTAATLGIPVAWNLAGGYQRDAEGGIEPVLAIHRSTMQRCADVFMSSAR